MCTDQVLEHPQEKQGASVAVHATTGEAQATWSTLQQQLQGLAAAVEKLQARDDTVAVLLATLVARNDLTATALAVAPPLAAHTVSDLRCTPQRWTLIRLPHTRWQVCVTSTRATATKIHWRRPSYARHSDLVQPPSSTNSEGALPDSLSLIHI